MRDVILLHPTDGFPVFASATSIFDSKHRQRVVDFDVPVEIDGVRFSPCDLVFADIDGVVVVPQEIEAEVIRSAWEKFMPRTSSATPSNPA
jgi:regulator of RNase E activity RraA